MSSKATSCRIWFNDFEDIVIFLRFCISETRDISPEASQILPERLVQRRSWREQTIADAEQRVQLSVTEDLKPYDDVSFL